MATASSPLSPKLVFFAAIALLSATSLHALDSIGEIGGYERRALMSFRETPHGSNSTFECSPSGPCVPCQFSEKNDEKYRCSETGYRIPLKCVETKEIPKTQGKISRKRSTLEVFPKDIKLHTVLRHLEELTTSLRHRRLVSDSAKKEKKEQAYITYSGCIQAVNEEKLSVIDFEAYVFGLLLVSGYVVYVRKRRSVSTSGFVRVQSNSRF